MKRGSDARWPLCDEIQAMTEASLHTALPDAPAAAEAEDTQLVAGVEESGQAEELRRWKAEQANKALWDFGGRMRQVQSDWKRLQEEIRTTPKRPRTDPGPTYSGPLLLLNQYYWEQGLGAGINSIKGDNMFGINMYGSYSSICQDMLSSSPAVNNFAPCNSSSNGDRDSTTGANRNNAATAQERVQGARPQHKQQKRAQAETHEEVVAESSDIVPAAANRRASTDSSSIADLPASDMAPAAAPTDAYDLEEIEAVCRQQNLTHLPASRRFIRALKIIRAAKQQAEQQQAQAQVALGQPSLPLVAVV